MIVAVTGGTSFIGRNLVRRLLADGHTVRCLVRSPSAEVAPAAEKFLLRLDDAHAVRDCRALDGADVVLHLAGATKAVGQDAFLAANVLPTRHLLEALTAKRSAARFVLVSSQAAAGPAQAKERPVTEEDVPRPVEAYGRSKLEAERAAQAYSDKLSVTIVRPCSVFGPYDRDFLTLFRLAARGIVLYPGTAQHWLSLLHVDDVVDGLIAAAHNPAAAGRTYFLSSTDPVQWRELGRHIASAVGTNARHIDVNERLVQAASVAGDWIGRLAGSASLANRDKATLARHAYWVCSSERARAELAFAQSRSLPGALRDTYYWYRQSGWMRGSRRSAAALA